MPRRLTAAGIDVVLVTLCCLPFLRSPDAPLHYTRLSTIAAVLLAVYAAVEIFTGITPGKLLSGLTVRRDAGRPGVLSKVMRGLVRLLPVGVFLLSLVASQEMVVLTIYAATFTVVSLQVIANYYLLMRARLSLYDAVAGTRVE